MQTIVLDNMRQGYIDLVDLVTSKGRETSPRGERTLEIPAVTVVLENPADSLPIGIGRKFSPAIAAAEALMLVGGIADPALMVSAGSNFRRFLDAGILHGAYGPRIRNQLPAVERRLRDDPDTRQAVISIWDARYDMGDFTPRDLPCTLVLQFMIRESKLELFTTMRSNDVWWGVAHDFFMFTQLQLSMATALGLKVGSYYHHANSMHVYIDRDEEAISELHTPDEAVAVPPLVGFGDGIAKSYAEVMDRAHKVYARERPSNETRTEHWYRAVLDDHLAESKL